MLPRRLLFIGLLGAAAGARAMSACSTDEPAAPPANRTSVDASATVAEGICPSVAPGTGDACLVPEGTVCAFGACGPFAQCTRGAWQLGAEPPSMPCPASPPTAESACPACWPTTQTCRYGSDDCSQADSSANRTIASCPRGVWTLEFFPCGDASTDVQGDARADHE